MFMVLFLYGAERIVKFSNLLTSLVFHQSINLYIKGRFFSQTLQVFLASILQVIKGLNDEEKKMERKWKT